jgi:hypothetical protein
VQSPGFNSKYGKTKQKINILQNKGPVVGGVELRNAGLPGSLLGTFSC